RSRQRHLLGLGDENLVAAFEAGSGLALGLADPFLHPDPVALGALLRHRLVPGREVAGGIAGAAPERLAALGAALDDVALDAFGALDAERNRARARALGIGGASHELAEPPGLDNHGRDAEVAFLVARPVGRLSRLERLHVVAGVLVL